MSEISLKQALATAKFYTPQELDDARLDESIDKILREKRITFKRKRILKPELVKLKHGSD
jgi:hypothetical protein